MTRQHTEISVERIDEAIADMERLILQHYPAATFRVENGIDEPEAIHLVAIIDFEDTFDVLDLVSETMMEIQIERGIPLFVIPMRPHERTLAMLAAPDHVPEDLLPGDMPFPSNPTTT